MEIIQFLNREFWGDSAYIILLALSLMFILSNKKKNVRARMLAIYSILVLFLVIYNPLIAPIGLHFFSEDNWSYMRIFYLLPLMSILAYAAADYYSDTVAQTDSKKKKIIFAACICITIMISGRMYDSSMYRTVDNVYKIEQDALEISNKILEDADGEKVRAVVPSADDIFYGIRQYTGDIILPGNTDGYMDRESLKVLEESCDYTYIVIKKDLTLEGILEESNYIFLSETENYSIFKKA